MRQVLLHLSEFQSRRRGLNHVFGVEREHTEDRAALSSISSYCVRFKNARIPSAGVNVCYFLIAASEVEQPF